APFPRRNPSRIEEPETYPHKPSATIVSSGLRRPEEWAELVAPRIADATPPDRRRALHGVYDAELVAFGEDGRPRLPPTVRTDAQAPRGTSRIDPANPAG